MKQSVYTIIENRPLARGIYLLRLAGDTSALMAPGQFVNIRLDDLFLRRPFSVADWDSETLTVIFKTVGQGTEYLAALPPGARLDLLAGLGNGFSTAPSGASPLLIGGGVGAAPLYGLAKRLRAEGKQPIAILGAGSAAELFYADEFAALGVDTLLATADGSAGSTGFVTDALAAAGAYSYVYACGPKAMLQAVYDATATGGQFSFEERLGCGFGACMGCSCRTTSGAKRVCKDGPVLFREEIIW